jgi:hypothetical protein
MPSSGMLRICLDPESTQEVIHHTSGTSHARDSSEPPCLLEDQQTRVESVAELARIFLMPLDLWVPDVTPMQGDRKQ